MKFAHVFQTGLLAAALAFAVEGFCAHIRVTPADDVEAIVEEAEDGDVVEFAPGTYEANLVVYASVTLTTQGKAVINAGGKGSAVMIRSPEARVENLIIRNFGGSLYNRDAGVRVTDGADDVVLRKLDIQGPGFGIRADRLMRIVIEDCRIEGEQERMVLDRGDGVFLNYVRYPKLIGNHVRNVRDGFYFENVDASNSKYNFFTGAQYGIHYMYTRGDYGSDNVSAGVIGGFALMSSRNITFENNTSKNSVEFGILLNVCDKCVVRGNRVEGVHNRRGKAALDTEGKGLFIYGPGKNTVTDNLFSGADIGVGMALGGEDNILSGNAFINNRIQVRYVGKTPLEWSHEGRGNFWSTYMGWDLDGDGIAEKPYQPNDSLDRIFWIYPEARFLMDSPVVALLRWLAMQFEIDRGKGITDSRPLTVEPEVRGASERPAVMDTSK